MVSDPERQVAQDEHGQPCDICGEFNPYHQLNFHTVFDPVEGDPVDSMAVCRDCEAQE